jgi:hypothetical protein
VPDTNILTTAVPGGFVEFGGVCGNVACCVLKDAE